MNRVLTVLISIVIIAVVASCGIDDMGYVESPYVKTPSVNQFVFQLQPNVYDTMFYGYEVFYRIYSKAEDAAVDAATISNWNSTSQGMVHANIINLGYKMMKRAGDLNGFTVPVPAADLNQLIEISLDFFAVDPDAQTGEVLLRYGTSPEVPLYRGMSTDIDLVSFNDVQASDQDVKYDALGTDYVVQAYVFAARLNQTSLIIEYSTAGFLGTITGSVIIH
jgi:hypothetical protein